MTPRAELRELRRRVAIRGLRVLDRRTSGAQALLAWRSELLAALGGESELSPQEVVLVEQVTRLRLFLDHADSFLLAMPSIILNKKKKMVPLVKDRLAIAAELRATLSMLGLKKIPKPVNAIDDERLAKILAVELPEEKEVEQ